MVKTKKRTASQNHILSGLLVFLTFGIPTYRPCLAEPELLTPPAIDYRIIDQGGMRTVATNWAYIGNLYSNLVDSTTGEEAIPLEFPGRSGISYLYEAGLWVGGIVGNDTLVSTAAQTYWVRHELYPDTGNAGRLVFDDYLADVTYAAVCADTFIDPNVTAADRIDGPHRPLNIAVRQECRGWADENFRDMVWVRLIIHNMGDQTIEKAFVGWHADPDIGHIDNFRAYADDLAGYRQGAAVIGGQQIPFEAVYAIDNNGDPDSLIGFTENSPLGGLGLAFVSGSPLPATRCFNWWVTSTSLQLDWGPNRPATYPEMTEPPGQPMGDVARYRMLSNGEIDYDQVFAAVDKTAEGWGPPPDTAFFAAGYDIRFVYSVGPYTLAPGDSAILNFIWFAGNGIHTDPNHFKTTFSFDNPEVFLAGLDFSPWESVLAAALALEHSGFAAAAPGPPLQPRITSWTTDEVTLGWQPKGTFDIAGYEIFLREISETFPEKPLYTLINTDSTCTITGLTHDEYVLTIRSADIEGRRGPFSKDLVVNLRRPMAVELHRVYPVDDGLRISWVPSPYPDIAAYHIKRFQETAPGETTAVIVGSTTDEFFIDSGPEYAVRYWYSVTVESGSGLYSTPSIKVPGMIMAFDGGPLIIDQTPADPSGLTDKDSVRSFWLRVLPETTYRDEDRSLPTTMTVFDFNAHPITVVLASGNFSETERIHELLQDYCLAGGAVLFEGRDLFNTDDLTAGQRYFGTGDFAYDYFGIREAYYPATMLSHPTQMNAEFIGASSMNSDFPDLIVDSTRTDWGIPKQLQPAGAAIPFVGWITGDSRSTKCIYTYESLFPDASASQGHCVGLLYDNGRRRAGIFNFPLSMMAEEKAASALRTMLAYLSSSPAFKPGDFDGDGFVGVLDAVKMVTWVFRGGPAPVDFNSADVNADCRINLLDIVVLVNYVFRGGPPPQPGCIQGSVGPFFDPPVIVGTKKPGDQATRSRLPVDYKSILLP